MATGAADTIEIWRTAAAAVQAPLIDVLCKGCGGDWKRVWLLGRV